MASVRDLKKNINYVLGDIIEAVYIWEYSNTNKDTKQSEAIIDEAIEAFDELIAKVNAKNSESPKTYYKSISLELEAKGNALIDKINKLG